MAATEKIQIRFEATGAKNIQNALNAVWLAQTRLTKSQKKYEQALRGLNDKQKATLDSMFAIQGATRNTSSSFSVLRSKMLLASFAAGIVTKAFVSQVEAFAKQEESVQRLASVYGIDTALALDKFSSEMQNASTFGDELINVVLAQVGAFGANVEQAKELTKATIDLAAGMGLDLNSAALLVAKSFGSATNALSRYDINLKSTMTREEKAAAIVEQVSEKYGGLAAQLAATTSGQLAQARNAFGDLGENIGAVLAPFVLKAAKALKVFSEMLTPKRLTMVASSVLALGTAYTIVAIKTQLAKEAGLAYVIQQKAIVVWNLGVAGSINKITMAMARNPYTALAVAAAALLPIVLDLFGAFSDSNYILDENGNKIKKITEEQKKLIEAQAESEKKLTKQLKLLNAKTELDKFRIEQGRELSSIERNLFLAIQDKNDQLQREKDLQTFINGIYDGTIERQKEILEGRRKETLALKQEAEGRLEVLTSADTSTFQNAKEEIDAFSEAMVGIDSDISWANFDIFNLVLGELTDGTAVFAHEYQLLNKEQQKLVNDNIEVFTKAIPIYEKNISTQTDSTIEQKELNKEIAKYQIVIDETKGKLATLVTDEERYTNNIIKQRDSLKQTTKETMFGTAVRVKLTEVRKAEVKILEDKLELDKDERAEIMKYAQEIDDLNAKLERRKEIEAGIQELQSVASKFFDIRRQMSEASINARREEADAEIAEIDRVLDRELESLRASFEFRKANDKKKKEMEDKFVRDADKQRQEVKDKANEDMLAAFKIKQKMDAAEVVMSTANAVMKTLSNGRGWFSWGLAAMTVAMGAKQRQLIMSQKPPKMEDGGLVGGKRHSQGGTMIEAERGEFIVSRKGVQATGLEALNRLNSGQNSGQGTSVIINNPILSSDVVEDELIPQIKEALRKGADIGIG